MNMNMKSVIMCFGVLLSGCAFSAAASIYSTTDNIKLSAPLAGTSCTLSTSNQSADLGNLNSASQFVTKDVSFDLTQCSGKKVTAVIKYTASGDPHLIKNTGKATGANVALFKKAAVSSSDYGTSNMISPNDAISVVPDVNGNAKIPLYTTVVYKSFSITNAAAGTLIGDATVEFTEQ